MTPKVDPMQGRGRPSIDDPRLLSGNYWAEFRVFLAVAKAKSFSRAATYLGMSQPTVGRNVRRLQDLIGIQLLVATKAGISLTKEGEQLAAALIEVDQQLLSISSSVRLDRLGIEGTVRLSMTDGLASMIVVPRLAEFSRIHPKIRLIFQNPLNLSVFKENQCDVMVAYTEPDNAELICEPLGFLHFVPVAAPLYIERYGLPTQANLEDHFFVDALTYRGGQKVWSDWQELVERGTLLHMSENALSYASMVRFGLGIGLLGTYAHNVTIAAQLDLNVAIRLSMHRIAFRSRLDSKPVKIVWDWLGEILGAHDPLFGPRLDRGRTPPADRVWIEPNSSDSQES